VGSDPVHLDPIHVDPVHVVGGLELLRVVSELVAAAGREDVSVMDRPMQGNETGS